MQKMKNKIGWRLLLVGMVAIFLTFLLGPLNGYTQTPASKKVLKIGVLCPVSGAAINWGYESVGGFEIAADEINAAGGLKVGNSIYEVRPVVYDSQYLADTAITAVKRMVFEDKLKIIVGEMSSAAGLAEQTITEPNKVIYFNGCYTEKILSPKAPYTFRTQLTNVEYAPYYLDYYKQRFPGVKTSTYIYPDDETGRSMYKWLKRYGEERGLDVLAIPFERGTKDLTPVVTKAMATNPDIIELGGSSPADAGQMINILKESGWTKPITRTSQGGPYDLIRICGNNANGVIYDSSGDLEDPKCADLVKKFKAKKYPTDISPGIVPNYDAAYLLFHALGKAGTVDDTDKIKSALESIKSFQAPLSTIRWTGMKTYGINHQVLRSSYLSEIINKKPVVLKKTEIKE